MDAYKEKLEVLDRQAEELVQASKYIEALDAMEEALNIRLEVYGETSDEYYKTADKLCELCNMLSMLSLQKEKFEAVVEFLRKAESLAQNSLDLKAITYNNMACYYRRIGKLRIALKYLQDALAIETRLEKSQTLADTHLNVCAVYSQLGKHEEAKDHIMQSIILLQDEFLNLSLPMLHGSTEGSLQNDPDKKKMFEDRVAVLAIAYHNLGVEYEYLKQYEQAVNTYKKAVQFAANNLGEEHQVVANLENVLKTAQNQIEQMKNKQKARKQQSTLSKANSTSTKFKKATGVYSGQTTKTGKFDTRTGFYNSQGGGFQRSQPDTHYSTDHNLRASNEYSGPIKEEDSRKFGEHEQSFPDQNNTSQLSGTQMQARPDAKDDDSHEKSFKD